MTTIYAFPQSLPKIELPPDEALECLKAHAGMTLRDYFAGQAVIGLFSIYNWPDADRARAIDIASSMAYELADAMLIERERL